VYDTGALVGRIAGLPRLDAVFSNSDHLQAQTALAADYFGLPGKDWRSCLRAKNKPLMRRRLAETGAEKVTAAEIAADDEPPAGLPYPVVLKPAEGVASEDVTLAGSPDELAERCAEFFGRRPGEKLVAEEYLPGTLRTLETLGDGETTWLLGGFLTTVSAPPWFVEERLTWDPLPPGEELDHVRRALGDLGVSFGACHTEFICDGQGGARLVEVNDRLIGDHDEFLMAELLDDDLFERVLRVHLGERLPAGPPPGLINHARLAAALGGAAPEPGGFGDQRMLTASDDALADVFITITVHLCAGAIAFGLADRGFAPLAGLLAMVREALEAALDRQAGDPAARLLRARALEAGRLPVKAMLTAGTLTGKARTGARDINKFYGPPGPNYLRDPR
jgi:hypothetical protein